MRFKQCLMKVWYISPLNTWEKKKILVLHVFKVGGIQSSNQEKIGENSLLVLFFSTEPFYFGKRHDMKQCTTLKFFFFFKPEIWDTLLHIVCIFALFYVCKKDTRLNFLCFKYFSVYRKLNTLLKAHNCLIHSKVWQML